MTVGEFDHEPGVPFVALAVRLGLGEAGAATAIGAGRQGALALIAALEAGAGRLSVEAGRKAAA